MIELKLEVVENYAIRPYKRDNDKNLINNKGAGKRKKTRSGWAYGCSVKAGRQAGGGY